jgi:hypothetical protein
VRLIPLLLVAFAAAPAHAEEFVMCLNGQGITPAPGTVVPPHARIVYYADQNLNAPQKITAKIGGKAVQVTRTERRSSPFKIVVVEIESDRTGDLAIDFDGRAAVHFTVKALDMPKEVTGITARYQGPAHRGEPGETFDGLAIKLPEGTPAVLGMVRLRRDASAPWQDIQSPVVKPESETRPQIRVGQFDCAANATLADLARGFDLEVSVLMLDGSSRKVTGFAPHLSLPTPLPPQPRPRNQRRP